MTSNYFFFFLTSNYCLNMISNFLWQVTISPFFFTSNYCLILRCIWYQCVFLNSYSDSLKFQVHQCLKLSPNDGIREDDWYLAAIQPRGSFCWGIFVNVEFVCFQAPFLRFSCKLTLNISEERLKIRKRWIIMENR